MDTNNQTEIVASFGKYIRQHRIEQKLSQAEVASSARISQNYLSELERGTKDPALSIAIRICGALNTSIEAFLQHSQEPRLEETNV